MRITKFILCSLLVSICSATCSAAEILQQESTQPGTWSTDVIGIEEMHLSASFWVEQLEKNRKVLKTETEISEFNNRVFSTDQHMVDLDLFPDLLSGQQVKESIQAISKPYKSELYHVNGEILNSEGYGKYTAELGLENIGESVRVQFALVVTRSDMRTYPTDDSFYKSRENQNLDRFQENGLFPGDALAVLHVSANREWSFVQSYNYAAWVKSKDIAIGDRQTILEYKNAARFLVITGDKVITAYNPEITVLSELQLDMGVRLPLADRAIENNRLYGQNPYTSFTVLLPVRNSTGKLEIKPALIARNKDVNKGYIPFTRENIIHQAFKFLGERYGWGHSNNARDCTGFVMEIYKTFGIQMPRNTGQQGSGTFGENTRFGPASTLEEKLQILHGMDVGDLIYVPGHVLMYIGKVDGQPYVIHDVSVFRYTDANGEYYEGLLNGVSVTPFIPLYGSRESKYIDLMYNIKQIR